MPNYCCYNSSIYLLEKFYWIKKLEIEDTKTTYTANVNRQTTDKLLFSYAIITGENV